MREKITIGRKKEDNEMGNKEGRKEGKEVITKNKCSKSVGEIINGPEEYGYGMERHKALGREVETITIYFRTCGRYRCNKNRRPQRSFPSYVRLSNLHTLSFQINMVMIAASAIQKPPCISHAFFLSLSLSLSLTD